MSDIKDETELKKVIVVNQRAYEVPKDVADAHAELVDGIKSALAYLKSDCYLFAKESLENTLLKAGIKL